MLEEQFRAEKCWAETQQLQAAGTTGPDIKKIDGWKQHALWAWWLCDIGTCLVLAGLWLVTLLLGRDWDVWGYDSSQEMSGSHRNSTNFLWQQEELQIQFSRVSTTRLSLSFCLSFPKCLYVIFASAVAEPWAGSHPISSHSSYQIQQAANKACSLCYLSSAQLSSQGWICTPPSPLWVVQSRSEAVNLPGDRLSSERFAKLLYKL